RVVVNTACVGRTLGCLRSRQRSSCRDHRLYGRSAAAARPSNQGIEGISSIIRLRDSVGRGLQLRNVLEVAPHGGLDQSDQRQSLLGGTSLCRSKHIFVELKRRSHTVSLPHIRRPLRSLMPPLAHAGSRLPLTGRKASGGSVMTANVSPVIVANSTSNPLPPP